MGDRFTSGAAFNQFFIVLRIEVAFRIEQKVPARAAEMMGEQHFGIQARRLPADAGGSGAQDIDGTDHPKLARRAASSSAISAVTSSSSPLPARISGRRCRVRLMRWSVTRPCGKL